MRVAAVVEQEAAAGEAVLSPVVDGAFGGGAGADDVRAVGAVVEGAGCEVGELRLLVGATRNECGGWVTWRKPSHWVPLWVLRW